MSRNLAKRVNRITREHWGYPFAFSEKRILLFARILMGIHYKLDKIRRNFLMNHWAFYRNHPNTTGKLYKLLYLLVVKFGNKSQELRKPYVNDGLFETSEWHKQYFARFNSSKGLFG